jgi:hypothetical protein
LCVGGFLSAVCPEQIVLRHKLRGSRDAAPPRGAAKKAGSGKGA